MTEVLEEVDRFGVNTESYAFDQSLQLIRIATKHECSLIRRKYADQLSYSTLLKMRRFIPKREITNVIDIQLFVEKLSCKKWSILK